MRWRWVGQQLSAGETCDLATDGEALQKQHSHGSSGWGESVRGDGGV